jgi:prepilin-type N-terminal cleavage/methylation domain-containing protein
MMRALKTLQHGDDGLTLIELLVTVAVIAIVFAVAVPVVLNITAGVSSDASNVSSSARADFSAQYFGALGASSTSDATYTYAVFNGRTIAKILKAPATGIQGVVTTLAGSGNAGSTDGTGTGASFRTPNAIAIDSSGNLFISDQGNNAVRKITTAGVVTTFSSTVTGSFGTGMTGIVVDSSGNVFVSDMNNYVIWKIPAAGGAATVFAGGLGAPGLTNATGTAARFALPEGLAIDASNNIYVTDADNGAIRKVTPAGVVTTVSSAIVYPEHVAVDTAGNLYVIDSGTIQIKKIAAGTGTVTALAGNGASSGFANGTGTAASFNNPAEITVDASGNVYVADRNNNAIRKITPAGVVTTVAGGTFGAPFKYPTGIAVDATATNLYVADRSNNAIRKITPAGVVTTVASSGFRYPTGIAVDSTATNLYVADSGNNAIRKVS